VTRRLYVGAISGTSVDGLDLALLEVDEVPRLHGARTFDLPRALRGTLLSLGQPGNDDIDTLGRADRALGSFIGDAVNDFLNEQGIAAGKVTAIGSHGQTVRHRPEGDQPFTLQIGDPNRIAERTGITTVADFRRRDMAAGGQGAPLVPPFHAALFRSPDEDRAVLNIGGIANLTLLPADSARPISGFDTGPGNGLMDEWIQQTRQEPLDQQGAWAASGQVNGTLLTRLLADDYLQRSPPKSTGREHYNLRWLAGLNSELPAHAADTQATLCAFTAESVARALHRWAPETRRVLVCGGGRLNSTLMQALSERANLPVTTTDAEGFDGDSIEAAAFAWLAHQTTSGLPGNEPSVSGASGYRVLGAVYPGLPR
jgi:anhydro-N-acetylmuramic acid kinase